MIKKLSLLLIGLGILIPSYSMAINTMLEPGIGEDLGGQNYCVVESNLGFVCTKTNNVLVSYGLDGNGALTSSYWWREDGLGFYTYNGNYPDRNLQGVITGFTFCEYDFLGNNSIKINNSLYWSNCFTRTYTYQEFKQYLASHTLRSWAFWSFYINGGQGGPVFIFDEGAFRAGFGLGSSEYQNLFYGTYGLRNFNLAGDGLSVDYSNVGVNSSPGVYYTYPDNSTVVVDTGDVIEYFEENPVLNFSRDMCYIGTRDLTSLYEDAIPYYQGTGYTIFEFYSHLYGNTYKLTDLMSFLDVWSYNFDTFFNGYNRFADGTPKGVRYYSGIGNVGIQYSNLTNPFLNNLSAYYFMGSSICDNNSAYLCSDISEDIAVYCYNLLKPSGNITYNPSDSTNNNVAQYVYNRDRTNYFNLSGDIIIDGESWNGTPLIYFSGGDNITGFNSFFSNSFNKFKNNYGSLDYSDLGFGFLPSYIVLFLLAIIFFRFLSH